LNLGLLYKARTQFLLFWYFWRTSHCVVLMSRPFGYRYTPGDGWQSLTIRLPNALTSEQHRMQYLTAFPACIARTPAAASAITCRSSSQTAQNLSQVLRLSRLQFRRALVGFDGRDRTPARCSIIRSKMYGSDGLHDMLLARAAV